MSWTGKDHAFVVCAWGESPYLEECLRSLRCQTVKSAVYMATSTPNGHIRSLGERYEIPVFVREGESGLADDWNFALGCAGTELVTLAHQDDVYLPLYTERMLERMNAVRDPILFSSGYAELRGTRRVSNGRLLEIKKLLCLPMRLFPASVAARRATLAFGDAICCPSVTFAVSRTADEPFSRDFRCDLDWDRWERLSRQRGSFAFAPEVLVLHRIHPDSETTRILEDNGRTGEDLRLFRRFWPEGVARRLARAYALSEKSNRL